MKALGTHVQVALLRAVAAEAGLDCLDRAKPIMTIEAARSVDWASATFIGARHAFDLRISGAEAAVAEAVQRLVAGLADREIPIPGQIVAEIAVTPGAIDRSVAGQASAALAIAALTVVD